MTIHLFISEALVSASMYTTIKTGGAPSMQSITYEDLRAQVTFLSQLFRSEFIFPTESLTVNLNRTLRGLELDGVIELVRKDGTDEILTAGLSEKERAAGRENYDFYCFLIWPFIEASWLGAVSLMGIAPPAQHQGSVWLDAGKVQDYAQLVSLANVSRLRFPSLHVWVKQ